VVFVVRHVLEKPVLPKIALANHIVHVVGRAWRTSARSLGRNSPPLEELRPLRLGCRFPELLATALASRQAFQIQRLAGSTVMSAGKLANSHPHCVRRVACPPHAGSRFPARRRGPRNS
jgi:hypothetical protein